MSIQHAVMERIRVMANLPKGVLFNPVAVLDHVSAAVVRMHGVLQALAADRELLRMALVGIAWDFGQYDGKLQDIVVLEWPPDPEPPKPEEKKLVEVPKGLVTLH